MSFQVGDDPADLGLDLTVDVGQLTPGLQQFRVPIAVATAKIGDLGALFGTLLAQLLDDRRVQRLADILTRAAPGQLLASDVEAGVGFGLRRTAERQLLVQAGDFLLGQGRALGAEQVVGDLVLLHGGVGRLHLVTQFGDAGIQPFIGLLRRVELRLELLGEVEVREGVGEFRSALRVLVGVLDRDQIGQARAADLQTGEHIVDDTLATALQLGGINLIHRRGGLADRRQPSGRALGIRQIRIEVGVLLELEVLDHARGERAGFQDLDLGVDDGRIRRQTREHRAHVRDLFLADIEHDLGDSGVFRGLLQGEQHHRREHHNRYSREQAEATPERRDRDVQVKRQRSGGIHRSVRSFKTGAVHNYSQ